MWTICGMADIHGFIAHNWRRSHKVCGKVRTRQATGVLLLQQHQKYHRRAARKDPIGSEARGLRTGSLTLGRERKHWQSLGGWWRLDGKVFVLAVP